MDSSIVSSALAHLSASVRELGRSFWITLLALALPSYFVFHLLRSSFDRRWATPLLGPPRDSLLLGRRPRFGEQEAEADELEGFAEQYGSCFYVPGPLGGRRLVIMDTKALAAYFPGETTTFTLHPMWKVSVAQLLGKGIFWADGDDHKRQRKQFLPGFSNTSIRSFTPVFSDSAFRAKTAWDGLIGSENTCAVIEISEWMNRISLDSIGIAGFSHDFGALNGHKTAMGSIFDKLNTVKVTILDILAFSAIFLFPHALTIPTPRTRLLQDFHHEGARLANELMERSRKAREGGEAGEGSIMAQFLKSVDAPAGAQLSEQELTSQLKTLILAGYETTSITLTWALIELASNPRAQSALRAELLDRFASSDPSWDELNSPNSLPYLDAVTMEILRLHPIILDALRVASTDVVLPVSQPINLPSGTVDKILVVAGTPITIPIRAINRSAALWGADAKEFKPERWLENGKGIGERAKEIQGTRHLLTFVDGPRTCLGRGFAITELKAVLSVLVRQFDFSWPQKKTPEIESHFGIVLRPKVAGEEAACVKMCVERVEA